VSLFNPSSEFLSAETFINKDWVRFNSMTRRVVTCQTLALGSTLSRVI